MTNSEARKRMQAVSGPEMARGIDGSAGVAPTPARASNGPQTANMGDGADGLSEVFQRVENTPFTAPDGSVSGYVIGVDKWRSIRAELRSIVREHTERAWDEGYKSGHSNAMSRMSDEPNAPTTPNPYRKEQS